MCNSSAGEHLVRQDLLHTPPAKHQPKDGSRQCMGMRECDVVGEGGEDTTGNKPKVVGTTAPARANLSRARRAKFRAKGKGKGQG